MPHQPASGAPRAWPNPCTDTARAGSTGNVGAAACSHPRDGESRPPRGTYKSLAAALLCSALAGCSSCNEVSGAPSRSDAATAADAAPKVDASTITVDAAAAAASSFEDLPDAGPGDLDTRARHLLEAIAQNDASLAADIVLPREAYVAARDTQDPGALYESKFKTSLAAHVGRIHRHEKGIESAVFVSFDLGQGASRVLPHKHEWKEPLWHATRSTLTYTIDGRVRRIEIAEMIAWRGNWYVAKLK